MTSHIHFSFIALIFYINAFICLLLAMMIWIRQAKPDGRIFSFLLISLAIWSFMVALEASSSDYAFKYSCSKISYLGIASTPPLFLIFVLEYSCRDSWLKKRNLLLLWIIPLISMGLAFTNEKHSLLWSNVLPSPGLNYESLVHEHGLYFWVHIIYSYICIATATLFLIQATLKFPKENRSQTVLLILAAIIPWIGNSVYIFGLSPIMGLDITPLTFTLTAAVLGWNIYHHHFFSLVPVARDQVVENMSEGVLVLDDENCIIDINPAAANLISSRKESLIGRPIRDVLESFPDIIKKFHGLERGKEEFELPSAPPRFLEVGVTPLRDQHHHLTGRVFLIHDITGHKKVEKKEHDQRIFAEALRDSTAALTTIRNVNDVLDRILLDVKKVVPHDTADFAIIDEHGMVSFIRHRGYRERGQGDYLNHLKIPFNDVYTFKSMAETGKTTVVSDTHKDKHWYPTLTSEWIRSYVGAPIKIGGELLGFLNLDSTKPNFFTQEHANRLKVFADQAAIAIQNARLFEQVSHHAEEMGTLYHIGLALSFDLNLEQVIRDLYEQCQRIVDIGIFYVALYDEGKSEIIFYTISRKVERLRIRSRNIKEKPGATGHIILTKQMIYVPDILDAKYKEIVNLFTHINKSDGRTYLGVPMLLRNQVVGVIALQSGQVDAYSQAHIRLIETIAAQAAIAIDNARLFARTEEFAITDSLTGLFNRRHFIELAEKEITRALRYKKPLSIILMDIDHFKQVNDRFGHLIGDQMLQLISQNCTKVLRKIDVLARYGGEEFTVLLPETDQKEAIAVAARIKEAVDSTSLVTKEGVIKVTASLGVAELTEPVQDLKDLINRTDQALYNAKDAGRNQIKSFRTAPKNTLADS